MTNNYYHIAALAIATIISLPSLAYSRRVTSTLQVRIPKNFTKASGNYDHREALFGVPPYGSKIEQQVYHAGSTLCDGPLHVALAPAGQPFILMVDRGDCTFVKKVRNAQHSGAMAVIIADNKCQCKHEDICHMEDETMCEAREPVMADDGSGSDITIAAMLMFKQDSDRIKELLANKRPVRMSMAWSLPNPDDHVEYDLWSRISDEKAKDFQIMWIDAQSKLGNRATFTPHYYLFDGMKAYCRDDEGNNLCDDMCTNGGRYCSVVEIEEDMNGITGHTIIEESLRRLCIWNIYGNQGRGPELFRYVQESENCGKDDGTIDCVIEAAIRAGIDPKKVSDCMESSGGLEDDGQNKMLQNQIDEVAANGIIVDPVAFVNGVPIRGSLDFDVVFKAVCAGYKKGTQPDICTKCADCTDSGIDTEYICVMNDHCALKDKHGVSTITFGAGLIGVVVIFGLLAIALHARSKLAMRNEVKGIMAEYTPINKGISGSVNTSIVDDEDEELELS